MTELVTSNRKHSAPCSDTVASELIKHYWKVVGNWTLTGNIKHKLVRVAAELSPWSIVSCGTVLGTNKAFVSFRM